MSTFNRQAAFDTAVKGIIAQGGPALNRFGNCCYRGEEGRKCAVGFLIPDEDYHLGLEGQMVTGTRLEPVMEKHGWDTSFLARLQALHDDTHQSHPNRASTPYPAGEYLARFKQGAIRLAVEYGLDPSAAVA